MDQKSTHPDTPSYPNTGAGQFKDPKSNSVTDPINRGKDAIAGAASDAA
jgi:hypothetical protein